MLIKLLDLIILRKIPDLLGKIGSLGTYKYGRMVLLTK
jgi:hypothetical protein